MCGRTSEGKRNEALPFAPEARARADFLTAAETEVGWIAHEDASRLRVRERLKR